jgi:peptidoglycan/LPS O-acetylase OafA/YrhL
MRYAVLDWVRIGGISAIMLGHGLQATGQPSLYLGGIGVSVMLILSGFVLRLTHRRGGFLLARLKRIYPAYWVCLVASIGIGTLGQSALPVDGLDAVLMVSGFCVFAGRGGCHLHTSWFIGLIVSLYVLYPWLARAIAHTPPGMLAGLFVMSATSTLLVQSYAPPYTAGWFPLDRVFEFGAGIYLAERWAGALATYRVSPRWLAWTSDLTFPVFLLHYQLVPVFWHVPAPWHSVIYLLGTLTISVPVFLITSRCVGRPKIDYTALLLHQPRERSQLPPSNSRP